MRIKDSSKPNSTRTKDLIEQLRVLALEYDKDSSMRLEVDFEVPKSGKFRSGEDGKFYHSKVGLAIVTRGFFAVNIIEVTFREREVLTETITLRQYFDKQSKKWIKSRHSGNTILTGAS